MDFKPINDGVDHINVYSKGQTWLGRQLSNFANVPIQHPKYGPFSSLEAFYYWLSTGKKHDHLRSLYGLSAKLEGKKLEKVHTESFQEEFAEAIKYKLRQNPNLLKALKECKLPLAHYYWFGKIDNCKVYNLPEHNYMLEAMEELRKEEQC